MRLRPYQQDCLQSLARRYLAGQRRLLVSLPTGTGKTVVFSQFPRYFRMKRRLLVLAHRRELLDQALAKFHAANHEVTVGVEQAARAAGDAQVVVASVQTLQGKRLQALAPDEFYLVVVDEAHHAVAPSYKRIFDHLGLLAPGTSKMLVGFTATPRRGDGRGLGEVFQEIAFSKGIEEMIRDGYLCPIGGWRVRSDVDLDGVRTRAGDFVESSLAAAVDNAPRNDLLIGAYRKYAPGSRCIAFCVNVEHAKNVAAAFRRAGLRAEAVWGAMAPEARTQVLDSLSKGEIDVVTNCNVLTEGFDEPSINCVLMARPTRSLTLYVQMVGRGTRLHPGKQGLTVIDIADNSRKHALAGLNALFDLPDEMQVGGRDALAMADRLRQLGRRFPWVDVSRIRTAEDVEVAAERIEFFRFEPPEEIAHVTNLTWIRDTAGGYRLALPKGESITVHSTLLGGWEIRFHAPPGPKGIGRAKNLPNAIASADSFVRARRHEALRVVQQSASWRKQAPTDKQIEILRSRRIPVPEGLTRGQASWMLGHVLR